MAYDIAFGFVYSWDISLFEGGCCVKGQRTLRPGLRHPIMRLHVDAPMGPSHRPDSRRILERIGLRNMETFRTAWLIFQKQTLERN